ncbi:MAG: sigma-70 family RNA polymerase sigma factor [Burkholderiales bacterium]|nr:MAG: sigma-70 family RNA polymerase sigma factor [Burkholderiales bacterium]
MRWLSAVQKPRLGRTEVTSAAFDLGEAYRTHSDWLQAWLRRRTKCSQKAADLTQDTFCRLLERKPVEAPQNTRAFLAVVARRLLIDDVRRRDVEQLYLREIASTNVAIDELTPERIVAATMELVALLEILSALPQAAKQAFLLSSLDGLTHLEIAERLGISDRTVKRHIARAYACCYAVAYGD